MKKKFLILSVLALLLILAGSIYFYKARLITTTKKYFNIANTLKKENPSNVDNPNQKTDLRKNFQDNFNKNQTIEEVENISESKDADWWVNSGAFFYQKNGIASTVLGELADAYWQKLYNENDPGETDNGLYPQNIFRLVTKTKWQNLQQEAYFRVIKDNLSSDSHRAASNGLLLFNRYQDGNNLYYTGVRVDGTAVIKKKINGNYYTMAQKPFFEDTYNRDNNPNLLPKNQWIGVKSEVKNGQNGSVSIKVFIDNGKTGNWTLALETQDDGKSFGGQSIMDEGYAGIRTDFMDVEFSNYKISEL